MARTSQQIYEAMIADKANYPSLGVLSSTSEVAIYKLILRIVAGAIAVLEQFFDIQKTEVQSIVDGSPFMTDRWVAAKALEFQDGDSLEVTDSYQVVYETEDPSKRIVTVASCRTDGFGAARLKVAKGQLGSYQSLDPAELSRFQEYIQAIAPAGAQIAIQSLDADRLKAAFSIYYDASLPVDSVEEAVRSAIDSFLVLRPFNGLFRSSQLIDAVQAVDGVVDVVVDSIEARADTGTYTSVSRIYQPESGYMVLDDANSNFNFLVE